MDNLNFYINPALLLTYYFNSFRWIIQNLKIY
ncbi:protein of unknown function [Rhodovastum atsumiense]|nr:protein of unknown function [Rhodovastum atsumiense]